MRRQFVSFLVTLVAVSAAVSAAEARPPAPPEPFIYEGSHLLPGIIMITFLEWELGDFNSRCPDLPATNGVSSTFVELPTSYLSIAAVATIEGSGTGAGHPVTLGFWTRDCRLIIGGMEGRTRVPPDTWYIEVKSLFDANVSFTLTVKPMSPHKKAR